MLRYPPPEAIVNRDQLNAALGEIRALRGQILAEIRALTEEDQE
jgi:hypothetical protein